MSGPALAAAMLERAESFAEGAQLAQAVAIEPGLHAACIAVELSFKAALLHAGQSDEQNRTEIRHDLVRADRAAVAHGFEASPELRARLAQLSRFYSTHRLNELARETTAAELAELVEAVQTHVAAVRLWLEKGGLHLCQ